MASSPLVRATIPRLLTATARQRGPALSPQTVRALVTQGGPQIIALPKGVTSSIVSSPVSALVTYQPVYVSIVLLSFKRNKFMIVGTFWGMIIMTINDLTKLYLSVVRQTG